MTRRVDNCTRRASSASAADHQQRAGRVVSAISSTRLPKTLWRRPSRWRPRMRRSLSAARSTTSPITSSRRVITAVADAGGLVVAPASEALRLARRSVGRVGGGRQNPQVGDLARAARGRGCRSGGRGPGSGRAGRRREPGSSARGRDSSRSEPGGSRRRPRPGSSASREIRSSATCRGGRHRARRLSHR